MPTFTAVTMVPLEGSIWKVLMAPMVVVVRSTPTTAMAMIAPVESCLSAMVCSSTYQAEVLSLNKHYCPCELHKYTTKNPKKPQHKPLKPTNQQKTKNRTQPPHQPKQHPTTKKQQNTTKNQLHHQTKPTQTRKIACGNHQFSTRFYVEKHCFSASFTHQKTLKQTASHLHRLFQSVSPLDR